MPTIDGFMSYALQALRNMLGECATWRTIVASPNTDWTTFAALRAAAQTSEQLAAATAAAIAKVAYYELEEDPDHADYVERPRALVRWDDHLDKTRTAKTGLRLEGTLYLFFEIPTPDAYQASHADGYLDFTNKLGGIINELERLTVEYPRIQIQNIRLEVHGRGDPDEYRGAPLFVGAVAVTFLGGT